VLAALPQSPDALGALGLTEYLLGRENDAVKHLEEALARFPQHLQSARALALIRLKQRDIAGAEQLLKRAAEESPTSADAQLALGALYESTSRPVEAESTFRRTLAIDSQNAQALIGLTQLELAAGRKDEVEKTLLQLSQNSDKQYRPFHANYLFEQ